MRTKKLPNDFEIVRLKIQDIDKKTATFRKTSKELTKDKVKMRSSEVIRIVTAFNPENLKTSGSKYSYVKDIIQLQVGNSTNVYYDVLCNNREEKDIGTFTLQISDADNNKSVLEEIRYKRLLCGSSYVRSKKELYIREELYNPVMKAILVGIPEDTELPKSKTAKYSTYIGLTSTDSTPVSMPNICVVEDFIKPVKDKFDIVKQIQVGENEYEYKVINYNDTLEETEENINCFDGAGLVDYDTAAKWAKEMGLDYVPSSWQIRVSPGIKGNLYTFPIKEYIKYLEENGLKDKLNITDLWGNKVNIKSAKISVFLTESQFKFHNLYNSFDEWKKAFITPVEYNGRTYKRTFNISEVSKPVKKLKNKLCSAYQVLNTLKFSDEEIKSLAEPTVELTRIIHTDIEEFIKFRGLYDDEDINKKNTYDRVPPYYKALKLNHNLKNDPYIMKKIDNDLKSFINDRYLGKLFLNGNYQTAIPYLLALMEHIVGLEVKGSLSKGEIYSNYWKQKGVQKVSVWRNPHIACEWANVKVVRNPLTDKWFKYQNTGIVIDIYGTLPLRLGTMDFDGDTIATVNSDILYNAVERSNIHTIRFVKENGEQNVHPTQKQEETFKINNHKRIMQTNKLGFSNNIGEVTNKVTKLWCMYAEAETDEERTLLSDYIKIMSVVNQLIIDYVKTGIKVPIPKEIAEKALSFKKPSFMALKKQAGSDNKKIKSNAKDFSFLLEKTAASKGMTAEEFTDNAAKFADTDCTVDRLCRYLDEQFDNIKADFYSEEYTFCFAELIRKEPNRYTKTYANVKEKLSELLKIHNQICGDKYYEEKNNINSDSEHRFDCFYSFCETELMKLCNDRTKLLEYVIYQLYTEKEFIGCDKSILWNVFGEDICEIYRIGNINTSPEKITKLENKRRRTEKKNAEAVKALRKGSRIVNIKDLPDGEITVTDTEISYISGIVEENQICLRLAVVLMAIYRKINFDNVKKPKPIKLESGQKNKVTKNQLRKLADIDHKQIIKGFKLLECRGLIHIDIGNLKVPKISVNIPKLKKTAKEYTIKDINEVNKIFSDQNITADQKTVKS